MYKQNTNIQASSGMKKLFQKLIETLAIKIC